MTKQDYYNNQQNTLKQHLKEQNTRIRDDLQATDVAMRTTWQQTPESRFQKRPDVVEKVDKRQEMIELARAGIRSTTEFLEKDMTEQLTKSEKKEPTEVVATVIEVPQVNTDNGGRTVERIAAYKPATEETVAYQKQVSEARQRELDEIAKQKEEKLKVRKFLQKDDWMFFSKFVVIHSYDDYTRKIRDKISISEITGVYLIANVSQCKMFVGHGSKCIEKCGQHFRMRLNSKDIAPAIRNDLLLGDTISVNFVKLKDTDFDTVKELADYYIHKYKCWAPRGYNPR